MHVLDFPNFRVRRRDAQMVEISTSRVFASTAGASVPFPLMLYVESSPNLVRPAMHSKNKNNSLK